MNEPAGHAHVDPLVHVDQPDLPDREADARAAAGKAVRDLGHALVGRHADVALIDHVAASVDALAATLDAGPVRARPGRSEGEWADPPVEGVDITSYDERPVSGRSSPWGLDLQVRREGDEVVARCTLRAAHEGAPGRSHGGIVAALFDDVYGFVLNIVGESAFTGELGVRYEGGVPIGEPLECRVRLVDRQGRKLYMTGELSAGGAVLVRSTATFITIPQSAFVR